MAEYGRENKGRKARDSKDNLMRFQKGRNPVDRAHVVRRVLGTLRSAYANDLQGYGFFAAR